MTQQEPNPLGLNKLEQPWYNMFLETEGREPKSMMELMWYASGMQQICDKERIFWGGVFGL